jgi:hypothetical protein
MDENGDIPTGPVYTESVKPPKTKPSTSVPTALDPPTTNLQIPQQQTWWMARC